jgi:hypothetical protein
MICRSNSANEPQVQHQFARWCARIDVGSQDAKRCSLALHQIDYAQQVAH